MKKALIALAVFGLTGGAAMAQSSVTLFGVLDANVRYTKSGSQTLKKLDTSGLGTSRFGVRGVEDLGGGLKAGFWLESEVNVDTGVAGAATGGAFWARRATVSLSGAFGEVRLGRNLTASRLHIQDFDPFSFTGLGSVSSVYSHLGGGNSTAYGRADNLLSYSLPTEGMGGFYGGVDIAAGENTTNNKHQSGRIGYKAGPLHVSGTYANADGLGGKYKLTSVGGSYDLGVARPSLVYSQAEFGAREQKILTAGVTVPLGQGQILASFTDSKFDGPALGGVGDARLFAAGYQHNLSKRTALYVIGALVKNPGSGRFGVAGSPTVLNGNSSAGADVGVRHAF